MVAVPVLAGALLRVVIGVLVDRLKPQARRDHRPGDRASPACSSPGWSASTASPACSALASCSASPARRSPWRCRWPRAGIRRSTRASRSASPAPAIRAPCSPRCSRRASPSPSAGTTCSASRSSRWSSPSSSTSSSPRTARPRRRPRRWMEYLAGAAHRRRLVVHVLLRRHLRRLRRPRLLADHLLQRRVRPRSR